MLPPGVARAKSHPVVEGKLAGSSFYKSTCSGPSLPVSLDHLVWPRRSRSSLLRVSGSSLSRRSPRTDFGCVGRENSPRNVCDASFRTSIPIVARTAASDETIATCSRRAMLGGEALEQRVRVLRPPHRERAELLVRPLAVEDEDAAGALRGDPAREQVAQLLGEPKPPAWRRLNPSKR